MNLLKKTSYVFYKTICISIALISAYFAILAVVFAFSDFSVAVEYLIFSLVFFFMHEGIIVKS